MSRYVFTAKEFTVGETVKGRRSGLIFVRFKDGCHVEFRVEFGGWNSAARTQKVGDEASENDDVFVFPDADRRLLHFVSHGEKILGRYWLSIRPGQKLGSFSRYIHGVAHSSTSDGRLE